MPCSAPKTCFRTPRELSHGADSCSRQRAQGRPSEADGKRRFVRMCRLAFRRHFALLWLPAASERSIDFDQAGQLGSFGLGQAKLRDEQPAAVTDLIAACTARCA